MEGFPLELPYVGNKIFNFTDGVNLLYGPNGCGKSTLIKTLKGYSGIKTGGWTHPSAPNEIGIGRGGGHDFPHCYSTYTPANCKANVVWDGTPSFFNDGDIKINELLFFYNFKQFDDGITDPHDLEKQLKEFPSAGQYRLNKINKVINLIKQGPPKYDMDANTKHPDKLDVVFAKREFQFWKYINDLYIKTFGKGKNTILLDEPERSLSHAKQKELFLKIIPNEFKDYQVIIATHSLYSIFTPNANIIEMETGYINGFRTAVKEIANMMVGEQKGQLELAL